MRLAENILRHFGADKLPYLELKDFKNTSGLGPTKSCEIIACFELGKRLLKEKVAGLYLKPDYVWRELRDIRDQ